MRDPVPPRAPSLLLSWRRSCAGYPQLLRNAGLVLACVFLLSACASRPQQGEPGCYKLGDDIIPSGLAEDIGRAALSTTTSGMFTNLDQVDILALSGGGQNGAFGAGYLIGWQRKGTMPQFEYVTGVSAGALLATQVFIDEVEKLQAFEGIQERDIVRIRYFGSLFNDALLDNDPLRHSIARLNDAATLEKVAARYRDGAILQVGVVSLDTGRFTPVNLGALAQAYVDAIEDAEKEVLHGLYIEAVLASTAIPMVMPPSYLNCEMMVDGGARNQIFIEDTLAALNLALEQSPGSATTKVSITALLNGLSELDLSADGRERASPNLVSIGGRSISAMLDSSLDNDLFRFCNNAMQAGVAIVSMDQIPEEELQKCEQFTGGFFNGDFMACVYQQGMVLGNTQAAQTCDEVLDRRDGKLQ